MSEISSTEKPIGVIDAQRLHDTFHESGKSMTEALQKRISNFEYQLNAVFELVETILSDNELSYSSNSMWNTWAIAHRDGKREVANKIRAIFEPKEGK